MDGSQTLVLVDDWARRCRRALKSWPDSHRSGWDTLIAQAQDSRLTGFRVTRNSDDFDAFKRFLAAFEAYLQPPFIQSTVRSHQLALQGFQERFQHLITSMPTGTSSSSQGESISGTSGWSVGSLSREDGNGQPRKETPRLDHSTSGPLRFTFKKTTSSSFSVDVVSTPRKRANSLAPSTSSLTSNSSVTTRNMGHRGSQHQVRRSRSDLTSSPTPPRLKPQSSVGYLRHGVLWDLDEIETTSEGFSRQMVGGTLRDPKTFNQINKGHKPSTSMPNFDLEKAIAQAKRARAISNTSKRSMQAVPESVASGASSARSSHYTTTSARLASQPLPKPISQEQSSPPLVPTTGSSETGNSRSHSSWEMVPPSAVFQPSPRAQDKINHPSPLKSFASFKAFKSNRTSPNTSLPSTPDATQTTLPIPHKSDTEGSDRPSKLKGLRKKLSQSGGLHIRTGSLNSLASLTSPGIVKHPNVTNVNVNCVVLGPARCGVSTLIQKFLKGSIDWVPPATMDEFWHHVVKGESRNIYYNITEVTGDPEFVELRQSMLRRAQVVILCFKLSSREQFLDATDRLWHDIRSIGTIPTLLVGTFHDSPERQVAFGEASLQAKAIGGAYFESSPLLGRGVNEIFTAAANIIHSSDLQVLPSSAPPTSRSFLSLVRRKPSPQAVFNIQPGLRSFKCVLLGNTTSGRANLVHRYLHGVDEFIPDAPWMTWKASVTLPEDENNNYALAISETSPSKNLDQLRRSTFYGVNVFAICYSASDFREESWKEIRERWIEECRSYSPIIPVALIVTKIDQREGTSRAWTKEQGKALATTIGASAYIECSAKTGEGVKLVFQTLVRLAAGFL